MVCYVKLISHIFEIQKQKAKKNNKKNPKRQQYKTIS